MSMNAAAIPALLDAMALAGLTLKQAADSLRAILSIAGVTHVSKEQVSRQDDQAPSRAPASADPEVIAVARATPSATADIVPIEIVPSPGWKRRRQILREYGYPASTRGRLADLIPATATAPAIAPAIAPLSPKIDPKILDPVAPATAIPVGAHPLPEDWQPTAGRRAFAVQRGGEIGAANLITKFCNHFHCRANEVRTAAAWQARFYNWIIAEWPDSRQPRLPLMRSVPPAASPPDDKWEALRRRVHATPLRNSG